MASPPIVPLGRCWQRVDLRFLANASPPTPTWSLFIRVILPRRCLWCGPVEWGSLRAGCGSWALWMVRCVASGSSW